MFASTLPTVFVATGKERIALGIEFTVVRERRRIRGFA